MEAKVYYQSFESTKLFHMTWRLSTLEQKRITLAKDINSCNKYGLLAPVEELYKVNLKIEELHSDIYVYELLFGVDDD